MKKFKPEELLELINQEANQFLEDATNASQDEFDDIKKEIEQWLTDLQEHLPSPLCEQAQPSREIAEKALAKLNRKSPKKKEWKGAELETPEPEAPVSPPEPPPPPPPSETSSVQTITKI